MAILTVLIGHYARLYQAEFYDRYFFEIANTSLAIFFVLSGYGIVNSLERRYAGAAAGQKVLRNFYFDRAFRIYVPYWLALPTMALFADSILLHQGSLNLLGIVLGAPIIFWFVSAILACYLVAPLLFRELKRAGFANFVVFNFLLAAASIAASVLFLHGGDWGDNSFIHALSYRQYLLGHVVLFSWGMMIPGSVAWLGARLRSSYSLYSLLSVSLAVFLVSILARFELKYYPMFIVSCFALCAMMIAVRPPLPLGRVFILLGTCSYSLFLFHLGFYRLLELVGINVPDSRASIAYTLLLSPLLIIFCVWLEKGVKKFHQRIKGIMPVDLGGAASAPVLAPAPASGAASTDRESS